MSTVSVCKIFCQAPSVSINTSPLVTIFDRFADVNFAKLDLFWLIFSRSNVTILSREHEASVSHDPDSTIPPATNCAEGGNVHRDRPFIGVMVVIW